jgi:DNA-binding CsgD family transcriptional regulator
MSPVLVGEKSLLAGVVGTAYPELDPGEAAGLAAALDEIPSPAFVIWADGRVAFANPAGRASSDRAPELIASRLLASLGGRDDTFRVTRILSPGAPSHYIAVQCRGTADPSARVAAAIPSWGITPRQAEVLALLALGQANKTIADALGCAGATVEIHVTSLLKKSGCESRSELVSRFWSEPIVPRRPVVPAADGLGARRENRGEPRRARDRSRLLDPVASSQAREVTGR